MEDLAKRAGITARLIWNVEHIPDYDFRYSTMQKIAHAFNISPALIFFPQEELHSRQVLQATLIGCLKAGRLPTEKDVHDIIHSLNNQIPGVGPVPPTSADATGSNTKQSHAPQTPTKSQKVA